MSLSLLGLPHELLLQILEHLSYSQDKRALQSVASTCKLLHGMAEACLYSSTLVTTKSSFNRLLQSTAADPRRNQYVQELKLMFSSKRYVPELTVLEPDLRPFKNLRSIFSESPECQPWSTKGTQQWRIFMDTYMHLFDEASLLNEIPDAEKPLQRLKSLTLYWSGIHSRYWDISPECPIFLLPQLQSLEISCARIGQIISGSYGIWDSEALRRFDHTTKLRSLALVECTVSVEALGAILSLPAALEHLIYYETSHHDIDMLYDRFATADSDSFNAALSQQRETLERLEIMKCPSYATLPNDSVSRPLALALGNFRALSHLRLGPFRNARRNGPGYYASHHHHHQQMQLGQEQGQGKPFFSDLCSLQHPLPPVLTSLRLDDFLLSLLVPRAANEVLAELRVDELLAAAAARGVPFRLDVALACMNAYLQRLERIRDQRPLVRKLVHGFAENFHKRQERQQRQTLSPSRGSPLPSESEPRAKPGGLEERPSQSSSSPPGPEPTGSDDQRPFSRLRVLTSKRVHVIPPYLHGEKRPRWVVRYDSWHPQRFVPDAHRASLDYVDDDEISSEDEDVEVAFLSSDMM